MATTIWSKEFQKQMVESFANHYNKMLRVEVDRVQCDSILDAKIKEEAFKGLMSPGMTVGR